VEASLKDKFDFAFLSYYVRRVVGYGIPGLTGISRRPGTEELIGFCAMSNKSGAITMFCMPRYIIEASIEPSIAELSN
jgi:predicted aconitase